MPIEFSCTGCSHILRVPDEHAGKHARCPQCSSVVSIPAKSESKPTPIQPTSNSGGLFDSLPSQQQPAAGQQAPVNPYAEPPRPATPSPGYASNANPYQSSASHYGGGGSYAAGRTHYAPHRGGLVLALGILAFVCNLFLIPGILAWILGSADLKEMKAGRMDPSGQGITTAGMVLGIIATCFVLIIVVFYVVLIVIGVAAAAAG